MKIIGLKILNILGWIITIISACCVIFAFIYQMVLIVEKFGFIIGGDINIFIPHWSALFYLGAITIFLGLFIIDIAEICLKKGEKMANRTLVKHGELELFKEFLLSSGNFVLETPKGKYEVLRARFIGKVYKTVRYRTQKAPLIVFDRKERGCGYTIQNYYEDSGLFDKFREFVNLKEKKDE